MQLSLAPMEGLVDVHMRTLLTRGGHFDYCVTEFLRVTTQLLPERTFKRICPESENQWQTPSGTPVHLQLLGSDPEAMADNACRAAELGAPVVNVNFGCPSRFVNGRCGGAYLLQYPDQIHTILESIRKAMPQDVPLTAKMRLGFKDDALALANAQAMESAGVRDICIHARTKIQGYRPPAHWHQIKAIKEEVRIPIIANGEIWNRDDYEACKTASHCEHVMLGRGAVADPELAAAIRGFESSDTWIQRLHDLVWMLDELVEFGGQSYAHGRIKQWFSFLKMSYEQATPLFESLKTMKEATAIRCYLLDEIKLFENQPVSVL